MQVCQFLTHDWRGQLQPELIHNGYDLEFWSTNCDCLPVCRFIPYCSSDVWSGTGPAPRPRQGRQKEKITNVNASMCFFFFFFLILQDSNLSLPRVLRKRSSSNFMFASNQFDVLFCYQLSTPSWDPWSSARSSRTSSPKESSRPRLSCCLAQGEFALSLTLRCGQLLDKSLRPS